MEYGLIGAKLGHSYSKIIHEAVCGYSYELHPLPTEEEAHALAALTFAASSIICAFGLASAAPRSPYRHLELCGIAHKQ